MSVVFQTVSVDFSGPDEVTGIATFPQGTNVVSATAALQGIYATYGSNKDHMMRDIQAQITNISWSGPQVKFVVRYKFDDNSKHTMSGSIFVSVTAATA